LGKSSVIAAAEAALCGSDLRTARAIYLRATYVPDASPTQMSYAIRPGADRTVGSRKQPRPAKAHAGEMMVMAPYLSEM